MEDCQLGRFPGLTAKGADSLIRDGGDEEHDTQSCECNVRRDPLPSYNDDCDLLPDVSLCQRRKSSSRQAKRCRLLAFARRSVSN